MNSVQNDFLYLRSKFCETEKKKIHERECIAGLGICCTLCWKIQVWGKTLACRTHLPHWPLIRQHEISNRFELYQHTPSNCKHALVFPVSSRKISEVHQTYSFHYTSIINAGQGENSLHTLLPPLPPPPPPPPALRTQTELSVDSMHRLDVPFNFNECIFFFKSAKTLILYYKLWKEPHNYMMVKVFVIILSRFTLCLSVKRNLKCWLSHTLNIPFYLLSVNSHILK